MPFFRGPFGRFARTGIYPGQAGMAAQLGPSLIRSPTAPGAAAKPSFVNSGATNAATSPVPTSILNGGKQTFGPLAYSGNNAEGSYVLTKRPNRRK